MPDEGWLELDDRLEQLVARSISGEVSFRLVLQSDGVDGVEALLEARRDDGSFVTTPAGQESLPRRVSAWEHQGSVPHPRQG